MGTIITFYAVAFSYFFVGFQKFLHKHLLYISSDFFTNFFKHNINFTRCYIYKYIYDHLTLTPGTVGTTSRQALPC
jgi:hypothetical protein